MLLLHDIGKSIPEDKKQQHAATLLVIDRIKDLLPVSQESLEKIRAIIDTDFIGDLITQNFIVRAPRELRQTYIARTLEGHEFSLAELAEFAAHVKVNIEEDKLRTLCDSSAKQLLDLADKLKVDPIELLNTVIVFYNADTAAYTQNHKNQRTLLRSPPGLEYLYEFNPNYTPNGQELLLVPDSSFGIFRFSEVVRPIIKGFHGAVLRAIAENLN